MPSEKKIKKERNARDSYDEVIRRLVGLQTRFKAGSAKKGANFVFTLVTTLKLSRRSLSPIMSKDEYQQGKVRNMWP